MATQGSPPSILRDLPRAGDRRQSVRHRVHSRAYASFDGVAGGMVPDLTEIENLSEAGMTIRAPSALLNNRTLNLVLDLSETKTYINTTGVVVWTEKSGRTGIRFSEMPDSTRQQLKQWLFFNALTALAKVETPQAEEAPAGDAAPGVEDTSPGEILPAEVVSQDAEKPPLTTVEAQTIGGREMPQFAADAPTLNNIRQQVEAFGSNLDSAFRLLTERAQAMTRASGAALAVSDGHEMICRGSVGNAPEPGARFQVGSGFSGECVRTGRPERCDDSELHPLVDRHSCRQLGIRSILAVPIHGRGQVLGLLEVFSPAAFAFGETDVVALKRLAEIVESAVAKSFAQQVASKPQRYISAKRAKGEPVSGPWLTRGRILAITISAAIAIAVLLINWLIHRAPGVEPSPVAAPASQSRRVTTPPGPMTLEDLRALAFKGDSIAQYALGARYYQGDGVKQDYAEAVRWFLKAAEQGHVPAQAALGAYYWAGRGVPQDLEKAYFWSALARANGDEGSKYRVAALTSRMSREQVLEAQQQAEDWLRSHLENAKPAR